MVDRRRSDRVQNPVGHIGRPGDLQKMTAGMRGGLVFHTRRLQRQGGSVAAKRTSDKLRRRNYRESPGVFDASPGFANAAKPPRTASKEACPMRTARVA